MYKDDTFMLISKERTQQQSHNQSGLSDAYMRQ